MTLTIRIAFAAEAAANILGAIPMLLHPTPLLTWASTTTPTPLSTSLLRWIAALILGLTPQLLLGLRSTPQAILSRRTVYWTLLAGEGALVAVMGWQGWVGEGGTGLKREAVQLCAGTLLLTAVWRVGVLVVRPDLLGEEEAFEGGEAVEGKKRE